MIEQATREILWNVDSPLTYVFMYGLLALALVICGAGVYRHVGLLLAGTQPLTPLVPSLRRLTHLVTWGLFQKGVSRRAQGGVAHAFVFVGFMVLLFATTMVLLKSDFGLPTFHGRFYLAITLLSDIFGAGVLVGCGLFAHRRYLAKTDLLHNKPADAYALIVLTLIVIQGFLLEGLRIHVTKDPWAAYSPIGLGVSRFFWAFSTESASTLHFVMWWFHTLTVYFILAILPYTKLFHVLASPANLYFRQVRPRGALENPGDLMSLMESGDDFSLGLGTIKDYSWKQLLDLDACTSCGRCQEVCPAYNSSKPLSPKWMILDTRNHALALMAEDKFGEAGLPSPLKKMDRMLSQGVFLPSHGISRNDENSYSGAGAFRAANPRVQNSVRTLGRSAEDRIAEDVMDPNVFWSCTTCYACVEACPVGINHVDLIIGNRRNMALMHGEIPTEAQSTLRALENRANPYGDPKDRAKWLEGLNVKILEPGDSVDFLYWVGCVSAYDPRKQKIAKSLVKIMQAAGLSFGVLGSAEGCTGDPARRLGEENLFQTLAKSNIEILKSVRFKVLVANCPHCFNTIKNEYPQFGNLGEGKSPEIIHHSVLLKRLMAENKISLREGQESFTFHDPCYLGRYNQEYEAPRSSLTGIKGLTILEMKDSKERGMCCGAGGGHFWMDLKIGERVNALRTDQAAATGAKKVATACPFCLQMMEDGVKITNREKDLEVKDISEVIAEHLVS